jgi:hypothetical protein
MTGRFTSPFEKGGMRGIFFKLLAQRSDSKNLPLPLFFKEGNRILVESAAK